MGQFCTKNATEQVSNLLNQDDGQQGVKPEVPAISLDDTKLDGKRRALLIGINYRGQKGELRGCINDVEVMRTFLANQGFDEMRILTEEQDDNLLPIKDNIIHYFKWLVQDAQSGDSLFLHYSGHGTRVKDESKDEQDGYDEALVPLDYQDNGLITDDECFHILVKDLPAGCRLTVVMDCCHSGSGLDLPFQFKATHTEMRNWKAAMPSMIINQNWNFKNYNSLLQTGWKTGLQAYQMYQQSQNQGGDREAGDEEGGCCAQVNETASAGQVVLFSGCKDSQTSSDVSNTQMFELPAESGPGGAGGACTSALISSLSKSPDSTLIELLENMRHALKVKGFEQVPQLSSTINLDMNSSFRLHC